MVLISEAEFSAISSAAALFKAEASDFEPGDPGYAQHRREEKDLDRFFANWRSASDQRPAEDTSSWKVCTGCGKGIKPGLATVHNKKLGIFHAQCWDRHQ
jgi:hypothetical protein